jgi:hypothetical protein
MELLVQFKALMKSRVKKKSQVHLKRDGTIFKTRIIEETTKDLKVKNLQFYWFNKCFCEWKEDI